MADTTDKLTHLDNHDRPRMVDVSAKDNQHRVATAAGFIKLAPETCAKIAANDIRKGNVLNIAEIAAIQGGKKTSDLIPLCHPLALTNLKATATLEEGGVRVEATAICIGKTGVEMEALTAVSVGLLTIYDMCKAVDKNMEISGITLLEKTKTDL